MRVLQDRVVGTRPFGGVDRVALVGVEAGDDGGAVDGEALEFTRGEGVGAWFEGGRVGGITGQVSISVSHTLGVGYVWGCEVDHTLGVIPFTRA